MSRFLTLVLALAATPALATGFSATDLDKAAEAARVDAQPLIATRRVAAQTEILRAVLIADMAGATRRIGRDELRVLTIAIGIPTRDRDVALSWLMRSGVAVAADGEISGIYSPLADAWLLLRWAGVGGAPRLIDAALVRGTTLRPETQPDWHTSSEPLGNALMKAHLQASDSFALLPSALGGPRLFALMGAMRDIERAAVLDRVATMLGGVSAWSRSNRADLTALDRATRTRPDTRLLALPSKVRDALTPMAVIASPQGQTIVMQSPMYPARAVFATFATPGAPPAIDLIDLAPSPVRSAAR